MGAYYIFYKKRFIKKLKQYKDLANVYYPCKVNTCEHIIKIIKEYDCGFEVDSLQVLKLLIARYNVLPEKILFNGLIRDNNIVKQALNLGVKLFTVDSMEAIDLLNINSEQNVKVIIRLSINSLINQEINKVEKWGISVLDVENFFRYIKGKKNIELYGFSFYFPQEFKTFDRIIMATKKVMEISQDYSNIIIDVGGGISLEELEIIANAMNFKNEIIVEPGRHLVGDCFDMVCKIINYKKVLDEYYVFLNVGIYSGFIDVIIKDHKFMITPIDNSNCEHAKSLICGCTSDISDIFGIYELPIDVIHNKKELLIHSCGAYCLEMYMNFSGYAKPKVMIKDGE